MNKKYIYIIAFFSITIFLMVLKRYSFSKKMIPNWKLRGCDPNGCGNYDASRDGGKRKHKGLDVQAEAGTIISTPCDCEIVRDNIQVYSDNPKFRGIEIKATNPLQRGINLKFFYVTKLPNIAVGQKLLQGTPIATVQNRAEGLNMKNHVHIEVWEAGVNRNPELYFL